MKYSVVTTFPEKYWHLYGKQMVETFATYWPKDISLTVYYEGESLPADGGNIHFVEYDEACPAQKFFRLRHPDKSVDVYHEINKAAVRFSYKVFAQIAHCRKALSRYVIWLDGDVVTRAHLNEEWLNQLHSDDCYVSALLRPDIWTECGFLLFDTWHPLHQRFMLEYESMYTEDKVFNLKAWHDCEVFDDVCRRLEVPIFNLSPPEITGHGHPFVKGILGQKLDHLKGKRKDLGYSKEREWK